MSELDDARRCLEQAEQAATAGDFHAAHSLLQEGARLQEVALGSLHPELANTLNNLAVVAEKLDRIEEAEASYRRAASIAAASLPGDDPMVLASRQNLEDFCRARSLPVQFPAPPAEPSRLESDRERHNTVRVPPPLPEDPPIAPAPLPARAQTPSSAPPAYPLIVAGIVLVVIAAVVVLRPREEREITAPVPTMTTVQPSASAALNPPPTVDPVEPAPRVDPSPSVAPRAESSPSPVVPPSPASPRIDAADVPSRAAPSLPSAVSLVSARVCASFSAAGRDWRCDSVGDAVSAGPLVFYTRVRSPRDTVVVHRWYHDDALRKTAQLRVLANGQEGYRTYSRQKVGSGTWRVEARSADGELLQELRFRVR